MPPRIPEVNQAAIVLTGSFNPTIFQPEWFARQNLLPVQEAEQATIKIMVPQVVDFQTARFELQVTADKFVLISNPDANPSTLKDVVLGTFFILEHTPLTALGLNRLMHFSTPSEEIWNRIGDRLAPKDGWRQALKKRPGLLSLTIQADPEANGDRLKVKVEPSTRATFGVYFEVNDHRPASKTNGLKSLMEVIRNEWEGSYNNAAEIADSILTWAAG
jgi:hypothetical protein